MRYNVRVSKDDGGQDIVVDGDAVDAEASNPDLDDGDIIGEALPTIEAGRYGFDKLVSDGPDAGSIGGLDGSGIKLVKLVLVHQLVVGVVRGAECCIGA